MEIKCQIKDKEYKKAKNLYNSSVPCLEGKQRWNSPQLERPLKIKENIVIPHTNVI